MLLEGNAKARLGGIQPIQFRITSFQQENRFSRSSGFSFDSDRYFVQRQSFLFAAKRSFSASAT
jgi:hypothetical protein